MNARATHVSTNAKVYSRVREIRICDFIKHVSRFVEVNDEVLSEDKVRIPLVPVFVVIMVFL